MTLLLANVFHLQSNTWHLNRFGQTGKQAVFPLISYVLFTQCDEYSPKETQPVNALSISQLFALHVASLMWRYHPLASLLLLL